MRTTTLIVLVCLCLATAVTAQPLVKFGVKGGLSLADFGGDGWNKLFSSPDISVDHKFKAGFSGGAFVELPLGTTGLKVHPEVLYVMKGSKADLKTEGSTIAVTIKNNYIEVPVLVKYSLPVAGPLAPNLFAGPAVAVNASCKVEYANVPEDLVDELKQGDVDNVKSMDFGLTFGGGCDLAVGPKGKLTFDVRYTIGLSDAFDDASADASGLNFVDESGKGTAFKNNDLEFMVGFLF